MKKMLTALGFAGVLATSTTAGVLNINNQTSVTTNLANSKIDNSFQSSEAIYDWTDVNLNHRIETKAAGTHTVEDTAYANNATAKSWNDYFVNSKLLLITGTFDLHTYTNPNSLSTITANINEAKSSKLEKVWETTATNDQWKGTGHHTSTITLTVTAKYDEKEAVTSLIVSSYISARTAGAFHSCWTSSQINVIRFIVD